LRSNPKNSSREPRQSQLSQKFQKKKGKIYIEELLKTIGEDNCKIERIPSQRMEKKN